MTASDEVARRFGANLKRARRQAGFSQEELSRLASLHRTEIGLLENGARLPRVDTLLKLGAALAVDPAVLLEGIRWIVGDPRPGSFDVHEPTRG